MSAAPPDDPAKPGLDILRQFQRPLTQEQMDIDREAYLRSIAGRHAGETIVCLGTGPSLLGLSLGLLDGATTIGCNGIGHTYQPDYYVIADPFIYGLHKDIFLSCPGTRILSSFTDGECDLRLYYRREDLVGLTRDRIYSADSTGYLCISTAVVMGAKRILLAGYDGYAPAAQYHCYPEEAVEVDRVHYEWAPGNRKEALLRNAFRHAAAVAPTIGVEICLITPSPFLGDLFPYVHPERIFDA